MNYYKILNITKDAELSDIKKAYFKLVREYPPEKFPEKFMEIREAYEFLQVEQNREKYNESADLPYNIAYVYNYAVKFENEGKIQSAIKVLEEGLKMEPDQKELLVYLGRLYNANDDIGKAVNVYFKLLELYPNDDSIIANAAISYAKRGYYKKAYSLFTKAFELGNREPDFLMAYSDYCEEYISDESSWEMLSLLLDTSTDIMLFKEALQDIFERYDEDKFLSASVDKFSDLVDNRWDVVQKCEDTIIDITDGFLCNPNEYLFEVEIDVDSYVKYVQVLKKTKFNSSSFDATLRAINLYISIKQLQKDNRLSEYLMKLADIVTSIEVDKYLNKNDDFITDDIELTVLSHKLDVVYYLKEIEKDINIFSNDYPYLAELLKDFLYDIETMKGTGELWDKYRRQYCIKRGFPEDADLVMGTEPFVREKPKVGRNDPCTCGSGKKYKKCCGK